VEEGGRGEMKQRGLARIWSTDGKVILGCGFLVSPTHILTCTHVFKGQPGFTDPPAAGAGSVKIDFILDDSVVDRTDPIECTARVLRANPRISDSGPGKCPSATEDITVLVIDEGSPCIDDILVFAEFQHPDDVRDHTVRAIGFPKLHVRGLIAKGRILGNNAGLFQLVSTDTVAIQLHYSGGAVWDDELDAFVGMVSAADVDDTRQSSFMIPTSSLAEEYPELRCLRRAAVTRTEEQRREIEDEIPTTNLAYLCNRMPQEDEVRRSIDDFADPRAVHTFIVHGDDKEAIDRFIERLHYDVLPDALDLDDATPLALRKIDWPSAYIGAPDAVTRVDEYLKSRVKQLGLDSADTTPMLIETLVLGREFKLGAGDILRAFLNFWAKFRLSVDRRVVVCLGLRYTPPLPASGWAKMKRFVIGVNDVTLRGFVAGMSKPEAEPSNTKIANTVIVTELPSVIQGDAEGWPKHERIVPFRIEPEKISDIYARPGAQWPVGGPIPMRLLAKELEQLLIAAAAANPR
jgi:hypothetical protein